MGPGPSTAMNEPSASTLPGFLPAGLAQPGHSIRIGLFLCSAHQSVVHFPKASTRHAASQKCPLTSCLFTALPVQPLSWHCSFFSMALILPPNRPSLNHLSCCLPPPCLAYRSHSAKVSGGGTDESTCGLEATPYSQSPPPPRLCRCVPVTVTTTFQSPELVFSTVAGLGYCPGILSCSSPSEGEMERRATVIHLIWIFTQFYLQTSGRRELTGADLFWRAQ